MALNPLPTNKGGFMNTGYGTRDEYMAAMTQRNAAVRGQGSGIVNSGVGGNANSDVAPTPKPISLYEQSLQKRLAGQDPTVLNAQKQQNTDTSLGKYSAMRQSQQQGQQAGFTPGTLQSQRLQDRATGQAAEASLSGQDRVNALARTSGEQAINDQKGLEDQKYQRGTQLVASIKDDKARQAAQSLINGGMDPEEAYNTVIGSNGTVNEDYRSAAPDQIEFDAFAATAKRAHPEWTPEQIQKAYTNMFDRTQGPQTQAEKDQAVATFQEQINRGETVDFSTPEGQAVLGQVPTYEQAAARGGNITTMASQNAGKLITLNGQPYIVMGSESPRTSTTSMTGSARHTDFLIVKDPNTHEVKYINNSTRAVSSTPPSGVSSSWGLLGNATAVGAAGVQLL